MARQRRRGFSLGLGATGTALAATLAIALTGAATAQAHAHQLGGGPIFSGGDADAAWIHQIQWTASSPVPGVALASGSFDDPHSHPYWTDTIQAPTTSPFDGSAEVTEAGSFTLGSDRPRRRCSADGRAGDRNARCRGRDTLDDPHGVMGIRVRVGDVRDPGGRDE